MFTQQALASLDNKPVRGAVIHVALVRMGEHDHGGMKVRNELLKCADDGVTRIRQIWLQDMLVRRVVDRKVD